MVPRNIKGRSCMGVGEGGCLRSMLLFQDHGKDVFLIPPDRQLELVARFISLTRSTHPAHRSTVALQGGFSRVRVVGANVVFRENSATDGLWYCTDIHRNHASHFSIDEDAWINEALTQCRGTRARGRTTSSNASRDADGRQILRLH